MPEGDCLQKRRDNPTATKIILSSSRNAPFMHVSLEHREGTKICHLILTGRGVTKNPRVRKIRVRNSRPEMGAPILWTRGKMRSSAGKPMSVKFLVLAGGGGVFLGLGGGGVPILFLWARGFF